MPARKRAKVPPPFTFPREAHRRVHGPRGHIDYRAYKPWLRDEFEFRCVYCLTREVWRDDGQYSFTIDHVKPKDSHPELECEYDNLVYACSRCNTLKSVKVGLPDPCQTSLGRHLKFRSGLFIAVTPLGRRLIEYLRLNEDERVGTRLRQLMLLEGRGRFGRTVIALTFGYPSKLPDLTRMKPPKGNARPGGVGISHFARQKAGTLPPLY
jgi:HNH endonuclease